MTLTADEWLTLATHADTDERRGLVLRIARELAAGRPVVIAPTAGNADAVAALESDHWELN